MDFRRACQAYIWSIPLVGMIAWHFSLDSRMEHLQYNQDGSIDLYIGAEAPHALESTYMRPVGEDGWFAYFGLYAPEEPFFDKSFSWPDFELIG